MTSPAIQSVPWLLVVFSTPISALTSSIPIQPPLRFCLFTRPLQGRTVLGIINNRSITIIIRRLLSATLVRTNTLTTIITIITMFRHHHNNQQRQYHRQYHRQHQRTRIPAVPINRSSS